MPPFQREKLVLSLTQKYNLYCTLGSDDDILKNKQFFKKWLLTNAGGFIVVYNSNIDYIGFEDIVRFGPFYNVYCLIENNNIFEDIGIGRSLLNSFPYYEIVNGKLKNLGWSGSVLSEIITKDLKIRELFSKYVNMESVRKIYVKVVDFGCIIGTQIWEPAELCEIYALIDRIGFRIKYLLSKTFSDK